MNREKCSKKFCIAKTVERSKRKHTCFYIVSHALLVIWMYVIYGFSAQNGETSGGLSRKICMAIATFINRVLLFGWNELQLSKIVAWMGYPIRKLAHMTEFGILALLYYWILGFYLKRQKRWSKPKAERMRYLLAFVCTVAYAAVDEFHQLFVSERSGNLFDIGVDATGACLALGCWWLLMQLVKKIRRNLS